MQKRPRAGPTCVVGLVPQVRDGQAQDGQLVELVDDVVREGDELGEVVELQVEPVPVPLARVRLGLGLAAVLVSACGFWKGLEKSKA